MTDARRGDYTIGSDVWPGLSKVIEEMGEALVVLGKIIGTGGETEYWGGRDLRPEILEELADVRGSIAYFSEHNFTDDEVEELLTRSEMKRDRFNDWHNNGHDPLTRTRSGRVGICSVHPGEHEIVPSGPDTAGRCCGGSWVPQGGR